MKSSERIVVLGSGIAGMCAALALGKRGLDVTLVERDEAPPDGDADQAFFDWDRRGATQFRHPHAFLGLMCNLLADNYPDLLEEFHDAGARRTEFFDTLSPELQPKYQRAEEDDRLWMLLCRRATIETVLRRYVGRMPNIRLINGAKIDGVRTEHEDGLLTVRALRVRRDCVEHFGDEIPADIIVDASGRTTKFPRWFAAAGTEIPTEDDDAEIVYYTRHYRLHEGVEEPPRTGKDRPAGDLGYIKFGVFPGDNRHFALIVCLHTVEDEMIHAIRDGETFDAMCRQIPGLQPWLDPARSTATTPSFGMGDIRAVWRHYVDGDRPLVKNFFAVGDAMIRTNPLYGRGCSTGILHAHILADVLTATSDPLDRALQFHARSEEELRPIFEASRTEDKNGIRRSLAAAEGELLERPSRSFKQWFGMAFADALMAAARHNLHVARGMMRTVNLLEKPGDFLKDRKTRWIIFAYMLRGRARNALARMVRGPTRDEMLTLVRERREPHIDVAA